MGWFIKVIMSDNIGMIEIFKLFRIGLAWIDDETGKASSLILGIWKLETNITFAIRRKLSWHEVGQA